MKQINKSVLLLFFLLIGSNIDAQISFTGDYLTNHPTKRGSTIIKGHAVIRNKGTVMYSDFAEVDNISQNCEAYGNLRIVTKGKTTITGRHLFYNGNTQLFDVIDDVVLVDGGVTMKTEKLLFNAKTNVATYNTPAVMTEGETILNSKRGYYEGSTKTFYCQDDVVVTDPTYTLNSDTMRYQKGYIQFYGPTHLRTKDYYIFCLNGWYDKNTEQVILKREAYIKSGSQYLYGDSIYYNLKEKKGDIHYNVKMIDTAQNCYVESEYGENNETKGYAFFSKKLLAYFVEESDTLFLVSDTLKIIYDTAKKIEFADAFTNVLFYRSDIQGLCDFLHYNMKDTVLSLLKTPLLWIDEYQVSGDSIDVVFVNQKPSTFLVTEPAFMVGHKDSTDDYNQIKGRSIIAFFNDSSEIYKVDVHGRSESIYYVRDDKDQSLIGINKSLSQNLRLDVKDRVIVGISFIEPTKNAMYPDEELSDREKKLKGFSWQVEKRPLSKENIVYRRLK